MCTVACDPQGAPYRHLGDSPVVAADSVTDPPLSG